jgi:hypothetical protein
MIGAKTALAGATALAAVSTFGDFVWATWITQHRMAYGLAHGAILFLCFGLFLGIVAARPTLGAMAGLLIGVIAAGTYYLLSPVVGRVAMVLAYVSVWVWLSALMELLSPQRVGVGGAVGRGAVAAVTSGVAFYLISGIWRPNNPQGLGYLVHFGAWVFAYFPGLAAILVGRSAKMKMVSAQ